MPRNNSKARKKWRQDRLAYLNTLDTSEERCALAMYGNRDKVLFEDKPGTKAESDYPYKVSELYKEE